MLQVLLVCSRKGTAEEWNELNGQIEGGEGMDRVHRDGVGMGCGWGGGVGGMRAGLTRWREQEKVVEDWKRMARTLTRHLIQKPYLVLHSGYKHTVRNSHLAGISQNLHLLSTFVAPEY